MFRCLAILLIVALPLPALAGLVGPVRVIDADTWDVGGERVRLFGIDAPEMTQTCLDARQQDWKCGVWATRQVQARFEGHIVTCERLGPDRYGRTIARCFDNGADVARDMVSAGLAFAYQRYSSDYVLDEKAAVIKALGLHSGRVQAPAAYRVMVRKTASNAAPAGCLIKGNISSRGERVFHKPGQTYYDRTRISAVKGERWFCSEVAALASGWRVALR